MNRILSKILSKHSILSLVLLIALIAAMALSVVSCDNTGLAENETPMTGGKDTVASNESNSDEGNFGNEENVTTIGEGNTQFTFSVTFLDGSTHTYTVKTNETTVGEALSKVGLISGEQGAYGLYVKTVDGVTLDYDKDGKYWAFYINGAYAMSGVDVTDITEGDVYAFKAE